MTTLNQARPKREDMTWGAEGDLGGYNFTPQELERATATYYMEKDMTAMAARIDQLFAENNRLEGENNRLEATINGLNQISNLDEERIVALEKTVIRLGGRLHPYTAPKPSAARETWAREHLDGDYPH